MNVDDSFSNWGFQARAGIKEFQSLDLSEKHIVVHFEFNQLL
jgi:hypothetical protein